MHISVTLRTRARDSSLDDVQAGDVPEVADIAGRDTKAQLQSGGRYQQILEGNPHSPFSLLALDAAGQYCGSDRHRIHRHVADEFIDERLSALTALLQFGALDAVCQFHDGHRRETEFNFSVTLLKCSRICRTVWLWRSAAMTTLESRINPTRADSAVSDYE